MKIISATEARRRSACSDDRFLVQINNEIKAAADRGEYMCVVHLDDIYTDRAAHEYRSMLENAGYQCNVAKEEHKYSDDNTEHDPHSYFTTVIALIWK